jgi:hypothetical protein
MECYWVLGSVWTFSPPARRRMVTTRFFRDFGQAARPEEVEPLPVQEAEIHRLKATASQHDTDPQWSVRGGH